MITQLFPYYKKTVWGGDSLFENGYLSNSRPGTGELWYTADKPGQMLPEPFRFPDLPFFFKLIDAKNKLSIQVHPAEKNEFWYILKAEGDAAVLLGTKKGLIPSQVGFYAQQGTLEEEMNRIPVKEGDSFYIPSGMLHAIGAGIVLCEVQQTADITYRVFDYNRKDKNGEMRPLQINDALRVYRRFSHTELTNLRYSFGKKGLVNNNLFRATVISPHNKATIRLCGRNTQILILDGQGSILCGKATVSVEKGELFRITEETSVGFLGNATILIAAAP